MNTNPVLIGHMGDREEGEVQSSGPYSKKPEQRTAGKPDLTMHYMDGLSIWIAIL